MQKKLQETTLQIIGAEFFNCNIEYIKCEELHYDNLHHYYKITEGSNEALLQIGPNQNDKMLPYEPNSLKAELEILELLLSKTKFKNSLEYFLNTDRDLINADFLIITLDEAKSFTEMPQWQAQQEAVFTTFYDFIEKINPIQRDFFGYQASDHTFDSWKDCFHFFWTSQNDSLLQSQFLSIDEGKQVEEFFKILEPYIGEGSAPSLLYMNPNPHKIIVNSQFQFKHLLGWGQTLWAPPEFAFVQYDYQQKIPGDQLEQFKQKLLAENEGKAKYFAYYVFFLLEEAFIRKYRFQDSPKALNLKDKAFVLMKNALN